MLSTTVVNNNHSSHSSLEEDFSTKEEYYHNDNLNNQGDVTAKKKKWWMIYGIVALLVSAAIAIAIAVPVSLKQHRKNSSSSDLNAASINGKQDIATTATTTTDTTTTAMQQPDNKNNINNDSLVVITADNQQASYNPPVYAHAVSPYANLTRLKILTPPIDSRIFVMGDIHGCLMEMNQLLKEIQFQPNKDVLILTGDLVFRGQDSIGVIRRAKELNALCVRGNHDDKVIRLKGYENNFGIDAMSPPDEIMPEGEVGDPLKFGNKHIEISKNMNVDDYNYLAGCPLVLDIPVMNARVVHGGLDPVITNILDNDPWSVMNMRDMDSDNQPSRLKLSKNSPSSDAQHWTTAYQAYSTEHNTNVTVYYGHDASRGVALGTKTIGLDSGCVYGRKLSTIEIKSQKLTQVDCLVGQNSDEQEDED